MSGYLFMVAHQKNQNLPQVNYYQRKKKPAKSDDNKSIATSRSSISSRAPTLSSKAPTMSRKSISSLKETKHTKSTKTKALTYDRILASYENKFNQLVNEIQNHETNEHFNRYHIKDGGLLLTEKNMNILRYTFFKNITCNYNDILNDMKAKRPDGTHKLKYMSKLKEMKKRDKSIKGLPSVSNENLLDDNVDEVDESDEEDLISDHYKQFSSMNGACVKELINSNQFWNNVYQDLKSNLMELSQSFNYFDLLPNIHELLTFYREIIEYFLLNLQDVHCHTSEASEAGELSKIELETLRNYRFYYLKDFNYEWFKLMSNVHFKIFNNQSVSNHNLSIFHDKDRSIHKSLLCKIIATIVDNLKISLGYQTEDLSPVFELWEEFFKFIIMELVVNNYGNSDDTMGSNWLPNPNLERSNSMNSLYSENSVHNTTATSVDNDSTSVLSEPETESKVQVITRNVKELSINSRIDEESTDIQPLQPIGKRNGFVLEAPSNRLSFYEILTPASPTFSLHSTETNKSYTSKRSIFSRLKRSKK